MPSKRTAKKAAAKKAEAVVNPKVEEFLHAGVGGVKTDEGGRPVTDDGGRPVLKNEDPDA